MFVKSDSELQKEYQDYFKEKMDKHGVDSPAAFGDEASMKKFFDEVSAGWECGKGRKEVKTSSINVASIVDSIVASFCKAEEKDDVELKTQQITKLADNFVRLVTGDKDIAIKNFKMIKLPKANFDEKTSPKEISDKYDLAIKDIVKVLKKHFF